MQEILASLLALAMVTCLAVSDGAQQKPKTLYERLGGYDAIAAVVDDFIGRLVADKQISRFFTGASTNSKKRIRQLVVDQICEATGGPCIYIGRSMKASHEGLGITENDWQQLVAVRNPREFPRDSPAIHARQSVLTHGCYSWFGVFRSET